MKKWGLFLFLISALAIVYFYNTTKKDYSYNSFRNNEEKLRYCNLDIQDLSGDYEDLIALEVEYRLWVNDENNNFIDYQDKLLKTLDEEILNKSYSVHKNYIVLPITIEVLLKMSDRTDNAEYLELSKKYGEKLLSLQQENGAFNVKGLVVGGWVTPGAISALTELYDHTRDLRYLSASEKAADYLIENQINNAWTEHPDSKYISLNIWTTPGAILSMSKLYLLTKNEEYINQMIKSSEYLVSLQNEEGAWSNYYNLNNLSVDDINYIEYATPGTMVALFRTYELTGNKKFLNSAIKAADWLISIQDQGGMWYPSYKEGKPINRDVSFWWDSGIIASIDALLRAHIIQTLPDESLIERSHWYPPWQEDEIFIENLKESVSDNKTSGYLLSALKGRDRLLQEIKNITCSMENRLDIYTINTILLSLKQID